MAQPFKRDRVTWLAYLILAFYAYFLNIFGPITPYLKNELGLSYTVSSFHFSAFALGIIGAGLAGHRVIRKTGRWHALWIGAFGMSAGALLLVAGRSPILTISASFVMGLVGSLILTIIPSVLADQHGELRAVAISEANVVSSILSTIAPLLVGWFAPTVLGWRAALATAALSTLIMRFAFSGASLSATHTPADTGQTQHRLPAVFWFYWAALVLAVSVEFCMVFWSADYLETGLGMPKAGAAQAVSLFLIGMILGRLVCSRLERRFGSYLVITGSLIIAAAGFLVYWTATASLSGIVGLFVTGLGIASLYPLVLSLAIGSAKEATVQASAFASLASGTAILALPLVLGRLADAVGIRQAYAIIIVLLAAAFLIIQAAVRFTRRDEAAESSRPQQ
ncbi:MAG: MFS transporter [Anaerolineae bacterium]|nr:MFS transporter [Anaerolineae bacterium]